MTVLLVCAMGIYMPDAQHSNWYHGMCVKQYQKVNSARGGFPFNVQLHKGPSENLTPCASTALSKHESLSDCCFRDRAFRFPVVGTALSNHRTTLFGQLNNIC